MCVCAGLWQPYLNFQLLRNYSLLTKQSWYDTAPEKPAAHSIVIRHSELQRQRFLPEFSYNSCSAMRCASSARRSPGAPPPTALPTRSAPSLSLCSAAFALSICAPLIPLPFRALPALRLRSPKPRPPELYLAPVSAIFALSSQSLVWAGAVDSHL